MRFGIAHTLKLALLLVPVLINIICVCMTARAAEPMDRYDEGARAFEEYTVGDKRVFYHRRMLG